MTTGDWVASGCAVVGPIGIVVESNKRFKNMLAGTMIGLSYDGDVDKVLNTLIWKDRHLWLANAILIAGFWILAAGILQYKSQSLTVIWTVCATGGIVCGLGLLFGLLATLRLCRIVYWLLDLPADTGIIDLFRIKRLRSR